METIELIRGDSSDLFEIYSKEVDFLDHSWEGTWSISEALDEDPFLSGVLTKNLDIFNDDSILDEETKRLYKVFEPDLGDIDMPVDYRIFDKNLGKIVWSADNIDYANELVSVSGTLYFDNAITPAPNKYLYLTFSGIFSGNPRTQLVKTDDNGEFEADINIGDTVKTPANTFFIFQVSPQDSIRLVDSEYILSVEIRQRDEDNNLIFRREVLQAKLKLKSQGVLS